MARNRPNTLAFVKRDAVAPENVDMVVTVINSEGLCVCGEIRWHVRSGSKPFVVRGRIFGFAVETTRSDSLYHDSELEPILPPEGTDLDVLETDKPKEKETL
jgi:hypothetical protein